MGTMMKIISYIVETKEILFINHLLKFVKVLVLA